MVRDISMCISIDVIGNVHTLSAGGAVLSPLNFSWEPIPGIEFMTKMN